VRRWLWCEVGAVAEFGQVAFGVNHQQGELVVAARFYSRQNT